MEFTCRYAKPTGEIVKAVLVGQNMEEVQHRLQEQGLLPIAIRPRGWSISFRPRKRRQTIKPEDFILFNQQFVALIRAGLPILKALDLLKDRITNPLLRQHIRMYGNGFFRGPCSPRRYGHREYFRRYTPHRFSPVSGAE